MNHRCLIVLSGGLDSTVLLYKMRHDGFSPSAISFDYGQRHSRELLCAGNICLLTGTAHATIDLAPIGASIFGTGNSQTGSVDVPDGHYAAETMKLTVVPNRNMVMLAMATAHAVATGCGSLAYAAHAGDHTIYPDCRPAFIAAMTEAIRLCDWCPVTLLAPFADLSKADIVRLGHDLGVPMRSTWSCYKGGEMHCGTCGTCVERREAFALAGVPDDTLYLCDQP